MMATDCGIAHQEVRAAQREARRELRHEDTCGAAASGQQGEREDIRR